MVTSDCGGQNLRTIWLLYCHRIESTKDIYFSLWIARKLEMAKVKPIFFHQLEVTISTLNQSF